MGVDMRRTRGTSGLYRLIMVAGTAAAVACMGQEQGGRGGDTASAGGDVANPSGQPTGSVSGGTAQPGGATGGMMELPQSDGGVVSVLAAIDRSEVEAGRLAQERGQNPQVKNFAREMINEHSRHMRQTEQLAQRANIQDVTRGEAGGTTAGDTSAATRSDTSARAGGDTGARAGVSETGVLARLRTQHQESMNQLRTANGEAFDRAYIQSQVTAHQQGLDLVQRMQQNVQNQELRQHLTQTASVIERHLERARELQQNLNGAAAGTSDTGSRGGAQRDTGAGRDTGSTRR